MEKKIKYLREQKGLTQEELGNLLGLKKATINKYETGTVKSIKHSTIEKMAEIFEVAPASLLGYEPLLSAASSSDNDFQANVGRLIYSARKAKKMSRAELGEKVELHGTTIKKYEDGDIIDLDIQKLRKFSNILDIPFLKLIGYDPLPPIPINNESGISNSLQLSNEELDFIKQFRQLDKYGRRMLNVVLKTECTRIAEQRLLDKK